MKIICIGLNYNKHIKELGHSIPTEPVFFMKPDTALLRNNDTFYIPDFSHELHYECELAVKIDRVAKAISEKFAPRCYSEVALGIDFTARDLQRRLAASGLPWEAAKAFDKSTPIPNQFIALDSIGGNIQNLDFYLNINGKTVQQTNTSDMLFSVDKIIAHVTKFVTLKIGDIIMTGTPSGVGTVSDGDHLEAYLMGEKVLDFEVK
ncbi:MAG: fumarylacetoacetate hydrolase family protein [Rikenellaceae bacterium]